MKKVSLFLAIFMLCALFVSGSVKAAVEIEFWSTDNEEDRVAVYEQIAARFMEQNPEVTIKIVPIEEGEFRSGLPPPKARATCLISCAWALNVWQHLPLMAC